MRRTLLGNMSLYKFITSTSTMSNLEMESRKNPELDSVLNLELDPETDPELDPDPNLE
jgi:hypothetical protein